LRKPTDIPYSEEEVKAVIEAHHIEQLIGMEGWRWFEDRLTDLVEISKEKALNVKTGNAEEALDAVRRWQLTDETVSTIRSVIHERLGNAEQLVNNPNDRMAVTLKEQLNG
jgi:hypothetical protein